MRAVVNDLDSKGNGRWSILMGTESVIAGAGAGLVSSIITCPLDVVKTKLQAQGKLRNPATTSYKGLYGSLAIIWREEGLRGCYRGIGPTVFGYLPTWAIYFTVYDYTKRRLAPWIQRSGKNEMLEHVLAATIAGSSSTIATNPLWVIKTRFMTQRLADNSPDRYKHTLDAFRRIYLEEGLRGFYRGLVPSLMGVSHVAIQFPLYEHFKMQYSVSRPADGSELPSSKILIASACSKMCASVITYPHEVIRTRLQIFKSPVSGDVETAVKRAHPGIVETCKQIMKADGVAGFYQGMGVNLIRTVPNSALTILTYELILRNMVQLTHGTRTTSS